MRADRICWAGLIASLGIAAASSAWAAADQITDSRDGHVYGIVRVGPQRWLDHNAEFATPDSWCPANEPANCAKFGRIYTWNAAQLACPVGTHLPSDAEQFELENAVDHDGDHLKSPEFAAPGKTTLGFNAQPGGYRELDGSFHNVGEEATMWSSTAKDANTAFKRWISMPGFAIQRADRPKGVGYQARCKVD